MRLIDIQEAFKAAVYEGNELLANHIHGPGSASVLTALDIYRNNTRQCLMSVLQQTFPVCVQLLGEACFRQLAALHVGRYPSLNSDVDTYGEHFANTLSELLADTEHLACVPYLADLASVEYLLYRSYFAANRRRFDFQAFAKVPPSQQPHIRFVLAPDIAWHRAQWPLAELWRMHQPGAVIDHLELQLQQECLVIAREGYRPCLITVCDAEFDLLNLIASGVEIEPMLTHLNRAEDMLNTFLKNGWIEGFHV